MEVWEKKNLAHNIYIIFKCDGKKLKSLKLKREKNKFKKKKKERRKRRKSNLPGKVLGPLFLHIIIFSMVRGSFSEGVSKWTTRCPCFREAAG